MKYVLVILVLALSLTSCGRKQEYAKRQDTMLQQLSIGMTEQQLVQDIGRPDYTQKMTQGGVSQTKGVTPKNLNEIFAQEFKKEKLNMKIFYYINGMHDVFMSAGSVTYSVRIYISDGMVIGWEDSR